MEKQSDKSDIIDAWITKYALSGSIFKVEAEVCSDTMISFKQGDGRFTNYAHGKAWHRTEAAAIAWAEEMRTKKIKSIEKQIAKLKALKFEVSQ